jgi:hypothetical protein
MSDYKTLVREMFGAIGSGQDVDAAIDRYMAEDFVEHEEIPGMGHTRDTPRQLFKMMNAAFTDLHVDIHDVLQDGDKAVARVSFVGTHTGEFMGVPASGNPSTSTPSTSCSFAGTSASRTGAPWTWPARWRRWAPGHRPEDAAWHSAQVPNTVRWPTSVAKP